MANPSIAQTPWRSLLVYTLLPISIGIALLCYGFVLEQRRMLLPASSTAVHLCLVVGGMLSFIGTLMLLIGAGGKIAGRTPGREAVGVASGALLSAAIAIGAVSKLDGRFARIRARALHTVGRTGQFRIAGTEFRPGNNRGRYVHTVLLPGPRGIMSEIQIAGPNEQWVEALDSVTLRYLPSNPAVLEVLDEELWQE